MASKKQKQKQPQQKQQLPQQQKQQLPQQQKQQLPQQQKQQLPQQQKQQPQKQQQSERPTDPQLLEPGRFGQAEVVAGHEQVEVFDDVQQLATSQSHQQLTVQAFTGPVPHPSILLGYEKACPGAANRLIALAEKQAKHRQQVELEVVRGNLALLRIGMLGSVALVLAALLGGVVLLAMGISGWGISLVLGALASVALAVLWGRQSDNKQLAKKSETEKDKKSDD